MEKTTISQNISLYLPPKSRFGGCLGLLIRIRDSKNVLIDCNFPPELLEPFLNSINYRVDTYFVTHFHMDHTAHVHLIEDWTDAEILMPHQEHHIIADLDNLIEFAQIDKAGLAKIWRHFGYKVLKFKECQTVQPFTPGEKFIFDDITIQTLHLPGHSPGHPGFVITNHLTGEKLLHVADLGLDDFGPWYGFSDICSLSDYYKSIEKVESLIKDCQVLISSHTAQITKNFPVILNRLRHKITERENTILNLLKSTQTPLTLDELNEFDIIFPISRYNPPNLLLYKFWQKNFLLHHLQGLITKGIIDLENGAYSTVRD